MSFQQFCNILRSTVVWSLLFISLTIVTAFHIFRWLLSKFICFRQGLEKILSPHSAFFFRPDLEASVAIGIGIEVAGSMNAQRVTHVLCSRMIFLKNANGELVYPEFQQYPVTWLSYAFWKWEKNFDIKEHIHFLPKTIDSVSNHDAFTKGTEFLGQGFQSDKSPWEVFCIEQDSDFLLFFKLHHMLADGYAIFNALIKCCDVPSTPFPPLPKQLHWKSYLQRSLRLLKSFYLMQKSKTDFLQKETSWDMQLSEFSPERFYSRTSAIPLEQLKAASKRSGIPLTSLLLSGISEAVRKYIGRAEDACYALTCGIPFPTSSHPDGLTNYISLVNVELPLVAEDFELRVQRVHATIQEKCAEMLPEKSIALLTLIGGLPLWLKGKVSGNVLPLGVSIFPGPKERVSFDGLPIVDMHYTLSYAFNCPSFITMLSYNGNIRIITKLDKSICKSQAGMERMARLIEEQLHLESP